jgi:SAM-dependent methyltransferase
MNSLRVTGFRAGDDNTKDTMNYNPIATEYDNSEKDAVTLWELGYFPMLQSLSPVAGRSVLDYGCGTGTFSRFLNNQGAGVTGVDVSENMIGIAKYYGPDDITYHRISSGDLGFLNDGSFDFVVSNFVLCTIPSRIEIKRILREISRVLRNNGRFIFMNSNWDKSNGKEFISFKLQYSDKLVSGQGIKAIIKTDPPIVLDDYYWSTRDYLQMLEESGLMVREIREPLAIDKDIPWIEEKRFPPYIIINALKDGKPLIIGTV